MKTFQIVLLIVFGALGALAVAFFSGAIDLPQKDAPAGGVAGSVIMWGTIPRNQISSTIDFINNQSGDSLRLTYVQKNPETYEQELLDSFAFGGSPDIFIMPNSLINIYRDKVLTIPYQSFSERMIEDTYVRSASVFRDEVGLIAYPFLVDPLMMFYNKDHFDSKGIILPPKTWDELNDINKTLTEKNAVLEIQRSGVAFGESFNVDHFVKILSALNLQLGNNISFRNMQRGIYDSVFSERSIVSARPAEETLRYYLEFSNPLRDSYSWNKSMSKSLNAFIAGDLSIYFGPASEISLIQRMNPNLVFDIASIPQVSDNDTNRVTYADVYGLAISRNSSNLQGAFYFAGQIANGPYALPFALGSGMAPARRDLISSSSNITRFTDIFYKSSIYSRSWVLPGEVRTSKVFSDMIESVLSGLRDISNAINDANTELKILLSR